MHPMLRCARHTEKAACLLRQTAFRPLILKGELINPLRYILRSYHRPPGRQQFTSSLIDEVLHCIVPAALRDLETEVPFPASHLPRNIQIQLPQGSEEQVADPIIILSGRFAFRTVLIKMISPHFLIREEKIVIPYRSAFVR